MNIHSTNMWSAILAAMTIGCWAIASNGAEQQAREPNVKDSNLVPTQNVQSQPVNQQMQMMQQLQGRREIAAKAFAGARPRTNLAASIRTAAEAVRDAKGDEDKAAAQKNLSDLLGKYFDEDTKRRQEELAQIEERLAKLRELLDRRRVKKQDILELQMKVALNEADGLGFYDSEQPGGLKVLSPFYYSGQVGLPDGGASPFAAPVKSESDAWVPQPKKSKPESKSSLPAK